MNTNSPPASPRLGDEIVDLVRLAAPVVGARAGVMLLQLTDVIIVGRYSATELAYQSIGLAPILTIIVASVGSMMGTLVLVAEAHGAGRDADCGAAWRRSLPWALGLGLVAMVLCAFGEEALRATGQDEDLSRGGGRVAFVLGLGMPGLLLFVTSTFFLEGLKRPIPGLVAMALANVVNVALALLLVPGGFGIEAMGAVGAAWATTIARTLLGLGMVAYVWWMRDAERFGVRRPAKPDRRARRAQGKLGVTSALSGAIEDSGFTILNLFAGWLGAIAVGAFAIGVSLVSMVFMAALGIGTATAVRVGFARGRGDRRGAARAGWLGLGLNTLVMGAAGLAFVAAPDAFIGIFTEDAALAAMVVPVLWMVALMLAVDGGQSVMASALRGLGDTWVPTVLHTISYLGVMAPLGWVLAFPGGLGIGGLFLSMLLASVLSVGLVSARFRMMSRRV